MKSAGSTSMALLNADEKVAAGCAGTVVYWYAEDFDARVNQLQAIGAILYRGPLEIEDGLSMCQLKDLIGIGGRTLRRAGQGE